MDSTPVSRKSLSAYYHVEGKQLEEQCRRHLSGFMDRGQLGHAEDWILFRKNVGPYLSIDEVALTQGELYTVVTNKSGKGQKGTLVAMVSGTVSDRVIEVPRKIPKRSRYAVEEITLDMAPTMERIAKEAFPKAVRATDRFHVQKLANDALQQIRVKHRWEAIEQENNEMELAKETDQKYTPHILDNGDTPKQLLARSRYLLFKAENKWTPKQAFRAETLFERYPDLKEAYGLTRESWERSIKKQRTRRLPIQNWHNGTTKSRTQGFPRLSAP